MFEMQQRIIFTPDWITAVFLVILFLIAISKYHFNERLSSLFSLVYSDKYISDYTKAKPIIWNSFNLIHFFILSLTFSLLIFYGLNAFLNESFNLEFGYFLKILLGVGIYMVLRFLIGGLIAAIFEIKDDFSIFSMIKISNFFLISFALFPLLLIIAYTKTGYYKILIGMALAFVLISILARYIRVLQNDKVNFPNFFYLFLYICALEIAPIILIYKLIVS